MASMSINHGARGTVYRYQFFLGDKRVSITFPAASIIPAKKQTDTGLVEKRHVEELVRSVESGTPCDPKTRAWLDALPDEVHSRISERGLCEYRAHQQPLQPINYRTLAMLCERFMELRKLDKPGTKEKLQAICKSLIRWFGADVNIEGITDIDASNWRAHQKQHGNGTTVRKPKKSNDAAVSEATLNRRVGLAKQVFKYAVKIQWIHSNPFNGLPTSVRADKSRQEFVDGSRVNAVIDATSDLELRAVIALARFAGLRIPSEICKMRWADIHFDRNWMLVHSPKTERCKGKESRQVPLWSEVKSRLDELRSERLQNKSYSDNDRVFSNRFNKSTNVRTQVVRLCKRAKVSPWKKIMHNLRSSRITEYVRTSKNNMDATKVFGVSPNEIVEYYMQQTFADFGNEAARRFTTHLSTGCLQSYKDYDFAAVVQPNSLYAIVSAKYRDFIASDLNEDELRDWLSRQVDSQDDREYIINYAKNNPYAFDSCIDFMKTSRSEVVAEKTRVRLSEPLAMRYLKGESRNIESDV